MGINTVDSEESLTFGVVSALRKQLATVPLKDVEELLDLYPQWDSFFFRREVWSALHTRLETMQPEDLTAALDTMKKKTLIDPTFIYNIIQKSRRRLANMTASDRASRKRLFALLKQCQGCAKTK